MKRLRLGIIGAGGRGTLADHAHCPEQGVEVVAGVDLDTELLERFRQRYRERFGAEVRGYCDCREMFEREALDGVFITSPDFCHEEQAVAALKAGIPVYLEKPMALSIAGCDRILQTARECHTRLMLGHNMRYMPFVLKMKELIDSGAIGEVKAVWCRHFIAYGGDAYFRDWHAERDKANSLLLQKGAHDLDVIHFLAGSYTRRVHGMGGLTLYDRLPRREGEVPKKEIDVSFNVEHWPPERQSGFNPKIEVEDLNMLNLQLGNGVFGCYLQCHYTPDACRNYTVIGTRGRLENYGEAGGTIELFDTRRASFRMEGDATFRIPDGGLHGGADPRIVRDFIGMLRGESVPTSTPQAARYSVATGCLGAESIRSGGLPFEVPPLPEELEQYHYWE